VTKILSISDQIDPLIYSHSIKERFEDVDLIISCGDLSYLYQEYIITLLGKPLYFVHGNHDPLLEENEGVPRSHPFGGHDLHRTHFRKHGLLMAGVEGSIFYNGRTPYQYTQEQMWRHVFLLVPGMVYNKLVYGRFLDVFATHSPPKGIHDRKDHTHQGIHAFRWLINIFQPRIHFHGHIHVYRPDTPTETLVKNTFVINTFRFKLTDFENQGGKNLEEKMPDPQRQISVGS
jgi:Icc-related predicted phosphoesterase